MSLLRSCSWFLLALAIKILLLRSIFATFGNPLIEQPIPPFMEKLGSGFITTTDDVDRLEFDWGKIHFLSEPQVTNAERFSFGIVELAQGQGHARHNHPGSEEIIYVVSGEGEQMVDDQPAVKVGPGASIYIPADIYHSTLNTGNKPMKLIVVYSPAGPERLLREIPGCKVTAAQQ
jgi:oxalate decarboxylase/phosphoglucose isomerase-like protein (cupin superfamily)